MGAQDHHPLADPNGPHVADLIGVGYQRRTADELLAHLQAVGVTRLVGRSAAGRPAACQAALIWSVIHSYDGLPAQIFNNRSRSIRASMV